MHRAGEEEHREHAQERAADEETPAAEAVGEAGEAEREDHLRHRLGGAHDADDDVARPAAAEVDEVELDRLPGPGGPDPQQGAADEEGTELAGAPSRRWR